MTTPPSGHGATAAPPRPALAGAFLQGLADQDFDALAGTLAADARLRALVPKGLREWTGGEEIAAQFARWFGDTGDFELIEATLGEALKTIVAQPSPQLARTLSVDEPRAATLAGGAIILRELTRLLYAPFQLGAGGLREGAAARLLAARQAA